MHNRKTLSFGKYDACLRRCFADPTGDLSVRFFFTGTRSQGLSPKSSPSRLANYTYSHRTGINRPDARATFPDYQPSVEITIAEARWLFDYPSCRRLSAQKTARGQTDTRAAATVKHAFPHGRTRPRPLMRRLVGVRVRRDPRIASSSRLTPRPGQSNPPSRPDPVRVCRLTVLISARSSRG